MSYSRETDSRLMNDDRGRSSATLVRPPAVRPYIQVAKTSRQRWSTSTPAAASGRPQPTAVDRLHRRTLRCTGEAIILSSARQDNGKTTRMYVGCMKGAPVYVVGRIDKQKMQAKRLMGYSGGLYIRGDARNSEIDPIVHLHTQS